ncbi:hypothetical protein BS17DRAFT_570328 [Gyrodon lividus]|nr:hypothetical protein BS17DRAFT_570328 [Gyrodon lividus]
MPMRPSQLSSDCIAECERFHPACPKSQPMTRVVDCTDPEKTKARLNLGRPRCLCDAELCLGESQPHSTTTSNINSYQKVIDVHLLLQIIKDAILCAHKLKLKYLWTDTLCILQDSASDKTHEVVRMHNIYRSSYITIVAASTHEVGFLEDRPGPMQYDHRLPFWCPDVQLGTVSAFVLGIHPFIDPVNQRAWYFQERVLSSRALVHAIDCFQYQCAVHLINAGGAVIRMSSDGQLPKLPTSWRCGCPPVS